MVSRARFILPLVFFISLPVASAQAGRPIPRIERMGNQYHFLVDGQPFLMLGAQAHNSSATSAEQIESFWKSLVAIHGNTGEVPLYWELIEPQPGKFDFHLIDDIVAGARRNGLRLVFLWFGTWKNGNMDYTPEWLKRDPSTYKRVIGARGQAMWIISPLCEAARDADARAFRAVMEHIRSIDEQDRTVIMMQVENETGLVGTDRDYSEEATRLFRGPVPAELMAYLSKNRDALSASLKAAWVATNFRTSGTWTEVFGGLAPEAFSAWYVARYVDAVAAAGKQAYPLPFYVNNWLVEGSETRAGEWPSGGPTVHVLDIWKAAAPHIDVLAPDIYYPKFFDVAEQYTRPDNPLFVPETNRLPYFAANALLTFAYFNGFGFSPFGIDDFVENGTLTPQAEEFEDLYRVLRPLLPLIARYQYTGKLHPLLQGIAQGEEWAYGIPLGPKFAASVEFTAKYDPEKGRGRGLIIELGPDDFVVAGSGFKVNFRELEGPPRDAEILSLEEGTFEGERWVPARRLNGDELHVELPEQSKTLRVRLLQ
ncbi:MAG TPA: DUF5597 domain-containing protein [Terriglobia bacterium]|nr:DUF5597 domain-containing protein [Terriglobia bacterium]